MHLPLPTHSMTFSKIKLIASAPNFYHLIPLIRFFRLSRLRSRPQEPRDNKPDSRTHRTRWVDGRNCLVGWFTRINDDRYPGRCVVYTLRVSSATLYVIRALIGSQCRAARTGVMLSNFPVHITARASEFWSLRSLSMLDFDVPYKRLLQ